MIIGLAGRISSGKRVLCHVLNKHGYKRIYFALPLKTLLTELLHLPNIECLDMLKNEQIDYIFDDNDYQFISKETNIPFQIIKDKMSPIKFTTVRQLLQYIGTDIIREYDPKWHINKIHDMLEPNVDYVIDDLRFPNEKEFIENMHGDTWYICRPKIDNVINHISETSLKWQDFDKNVIINAGSQENLEFKWDTFVENYQDHMAHRIGTIASISKGEIGIDTIEDSFTALDMLMLHKDLFTYQPKAWNMKNIQSYHIDDSNNLVITYNDSRIEYVPNKLNIEDFKILI